MSTPDPTHSVRQPLAIVGASTRAAAQSAYRAGFQPITADLFADLDLRQIATATRISPYPEGLLDWLRAIQPPAWMYTGALENYPELVDEMAWIAPLWGNPGDVLEEVRSPWILGDTLRDSGYLFPETRPTSEGLPRDGTWLAKTYRGGSGSGVRLFGSASISDEAPVCYQRRISGTPCAAVFIGNGQIAMFHGLTRQLVGERWLHAGEFQYAGSIGPYQVAETALADIVRVGLELANRFSLTGLFGVDFIYDGERAWIIEVNPRFTASVEIVERCLGTCLVPAHVAAYGEMDVWQQIKLAQNSPLLESNVPPVSGLVHGKGILFAKQPVVISSQFAEWALAESLFEPWPNVADISPAGTPTSPGRPVITVFASGARDADVEQQLRQRVAEVESRLYAK